MLNTIYENYEFIPVRGSYILHLHRDLYKYSQKAIGERYKNSQNYISVVNEAGERSILFTPLAPYETPSAVDAICENYGRMADNGSVDILILIPVFIHDFLCIHPFSDDGVIIGTRLEKPSKINGFALLSPNFFMPERENGITSLLHILLASSMKV